MRQYMTKDCEIQVRALEKDYDRAWGLGDLDGLLSLFTEEAVIRDPLGNMLRGKAEIRRGLGEVLKKDMAGSTHKSRIIGVEFIESHVAIVDGEVKIGNPDSDSQFLMHGFADILVWINGKWWISQVRAFQLL